MYVIIMYMFCDLDPFVRKWTKLCTARKLLHTLSKWTSTTNQLRWRTAQNAILKN